MPYVYAACDIIIESFRSKSWNFAGSIKTLESCAVGTPIILAKSPARSEMLGNDYKLYITKKELAKENPVALKKLIIRLLVNKEFYNEMSEYVYQKIQPYSQNNMAIYLEKIFKKIINGSKF